MRPALASPQLLCLSLDTSFALHAHQHLNQLADSVKTILQGVSAVEISRQC